MGGLEEWERIYAQNQILHGPCTILLMNKFSCNGFTRRNWTTLFPINILLCLKKCKCVINFFPIFSGVSRVLFYFTWNENWHWIRFFYSFYYRFYYILSWISFVVIHWEYCLDLFQHYKINVEKKSCLNMERCMVDIQYVQELERRVHYIPFAQNVLHYSGIKVHK